MKPLNQLLNNLIIQVKYTFILLKLKTTLVLRNISFVLIGFRVCQLKSHVEKNITADIFKKLIQIERPQHCRLIIEMRKMVNIKLAFNHHNDDRIFPMHSSMMMDSF